MAVWLTQHIAILTGLGLMHVWLTGSSQNALTYVLCIMVVLQQSLLYEQSKPLFSLALWGKKCNNLNMSGDTPSTFTATILFMHFRILYIVLLHVNVGAN